MLDVGCGGGQTVATLAGTSRDAHVDGVDYSAESVATARRTNRASIESGRVTIQQASVSHLPFADGTFDLVTAVETHYYWPNLLSDVQEIRRVLRPGGRFALIAETYRGRSFDLPFRLIMTLLRATYLTAGEHRALLTTNGFVDIEMYRGARERLDLRDRPPPRSAHVMSLLHFLAAHRAEFLALLLQHIVLVGVVDRRGHRDRHSGRRARGAPAAPRRADRLARQRRPDDSEPGDVRLPAAAAARRRPRRARRDRRADPLRAAADHPDDGGGAARRRSRRSSRRARRWA